MRKYRRSIVPRSLFRSRPPRRRRQKHSPPPIARRLFRRWPRRAPHATSARDETQPSLRVLPGPPERVQQLRRADGRAPGGKATPGRGMVAQAPGRGVPHLHRVAAPSRAEGARVAWPLLLVRSADGRGAPVSGQAVCGRTGPPVQALGKTGGAATDSALGSQRVARARDGQPGAVLARIDLRAVHQSAPVHRGGSPSLAEPRTAHTVVRADGRAALRSEGANRAIRYHAGRCLHRFLHQSPLMDQPHRGSPRSAGPWPGNSATASSIRD